MPEYDFAINGATVVMPAAALAINVGIAGERIRTLPGPRHTATPGRYWGGSSGIGPLWSPIKNISAPPASASRRYSRSRLARATTGCRARSAPPTPRRTSIVCPSNNLRS
jgi:hypothetical protein